MAGGSGKRLWPASRQSKPKQLIPFVNGQSLLALAVDRLAGLFPPECILVVTNHAYASQVQREFPSLPARNVIGEPEGRDTANAVALAAELVAARDPQAVMAVFTADHVIRPEGEFRRCVNLACQAAENDPQALVTFGISPTFPHTGLGYIHCGEKVADGVRKVREFKEKPDHHTARRYVESGEYFWNSGMFVWQVGAILAALRQYLPASAGQLARVGQAAAQGKDFQPLLAEIYPQLPRISIDYAVMEKAPHVLMVELTCQWMDVGSWPALADVVALDGSDNAVAAATVELIDANRNVIYSDDKKHLIAVMGMDDCVVVHTGDVTLICNKADSQRLKEIVDGLAQKYGSEYV